MKVLLLYPGGIVKMLSLRPGVVVKDSAVNAARVIVKVSLVIVSRGCCESAVRGCWESVVNAAGVIVKCGL